MNIAQYLRESREELARVSWPSRSDIVEGTQAVLVFVIGLTLLVYLMDLIFGTLIRAVLI